MQDDNFVKRSTFISTRQHAEPPGSVIRFFLSSTFSDFQVERNILQQHVFPELRQIAVAAGLRFQPIDLRWGVSEAASNDRRTLRICFEEIERCRRMSPNFFLLIQLGSRYGSYILPPQIPFDLYSQLAMKLSLSNQNVFSRMYYLDENAVPSEYVLLRTEGEERQEDEHLRQALLLAGKEVGIDADLLLLFAGSATHREVQFGLLSQPSMNQESAGVLCALRSFTGNPRGPQLDRFIERESERLSMLEQLTSAVADRLLPQALMRYDVAWEGEKGPRFVEEIIAQQYLNLLRPKIESIISMRSTLFISKAGSMHQDPVSINASFERERARYVVGRDEELRVLATYLTKESTPVSPMVVTGTSGSGKSALLAAIAMQARQRHPHEIQIVRYIGITPGTISLLTLLNGLYHSIIEAYGFPDVGLIHNEATMIEMMRQQLATIQIPEEKPLCIVLDAFDQLDTAPQRIDWLPIQLAPHVHVIISLLDNRDELTYLQHKIPEEHILRLAPLHIDAGRKILQNLLHQSPPRTITRQQEAAVLTAFAVHGLPLHLHLLAHEVRRWRSFDVPAVGDNLTKDNSSTLPTTIPDLLGAVLARLESPAYNGYEMVARSLSYLAASRFGLAEDELLDILAQDEHVREEYHRLSPSSPPIDEQLPLPIALWARLYSDLMPLLSEHVADAGIQLYSFYHQQLRTVVETRYLQGNERTERHLTIARYFAEQSWHLGHEKWNWRKVRELISQWEDAGNRSAAENDLVGLEGELEQSYQKGSISQTDLADLLEVLQYQLHLGGYWRVGERFYRMQLATVQAHGDRFAEADALSNLGILLINLGRTPEGTQELERALIIAREIGNRSVEGDILNSLALTALEQGHVETARDEFEHALAIFRAIGNRVSEVKILHGLGSLAHGLGHGEEAKYYYEHALSIVQEIGDMTNEAAILNSLASLLSLQGQHIQAVIHLRRAITLQRELHALAGLGISLLNLGVVEHALGHDEDAVQHFKESLSIAEEIGYRKNEAFLLHNLGQLYEDTGRKSDAKDLYFRALAIARNLHAQAEEASILNSLGQLALEAGHIPEADQHLNASLAIRREIHDRPGEVKTLINLGRLSEKRRQRLKAISYYELAFILANEVGILSSQGIALNNLGIIAQSQGNIDLAIDYYEQALALLDSIEEHILSTTVRRNLELVMGQRNRRIRWPFSRRSTRASSK